MAPDSSDPFILESLKAEVLTLIDQIETIREELFDYRKTLGQQDSRSIPLMSHADLRKMKDTLVLILGEALEAKRIKTGRH